MYYDRTKHNKLNRHIVHLKNNTKTLLLTKSLLVSPYYIPFSFGFERGSCGRLARHMQACRGVHVHRFQN